MSFLAPAFLGALGLVGVPILIHLIRRRRVRTVPWAAMEFLRLSVRRQRRRMRIEELILLLVRVAIVALIVLAFARPVLRSLGLPILGANARVYAVIVLDDSLSMKYRPVPDGPSSFDRAIGSARQIAREILKPGDAASLLLLSDRPDAAIGAPTYDLGALKRKLDAVRPTDRATDYLATVQAVDRLLRGSHTLNKEVYWITDDTATAWAGSRSDSARSAWQQMGRDAHVTWVSAGAPPAQRHNLAVMAPVVSRTLLTPDLPARIESEIANFGSEKPADAVAELVVDGRLAAARPVHVPANGEQETDFPPYLFADQGYHVGNIRLAALHHPDGLPDDDSAQYAARVQSRIGVLILDAGSGSGRAESYYLTTAMAPGGGQSSLQPKVRRGSGVTPGDLRGSSAVVLVDAHAMPAAERQALRAYVAAGGGLLLFPGPGTNAAAVNASLGGLLPARLGDRRTLPYSGAVSLNPASISASALAEFKDTSVMNLGAARFTSYFALDPDRSASGADVRVDLRFGNGDPALVERTIGLGRVIVAASDAANAWSDLPLQPAYVPLVYQLITYLSEGAASRLNLRQDEPIFLALPLSAAHQPVRVTKPDGTAVSANTVLDSRGVTLTFGETQEAGIYRVSVNGRQAAAFAVALPAAESDLRYTEPAAAANRAGLERLAVAVEPRDLVKTVRRVRYGTEIWRTIAYALLPLLFLESLLAQRFGRRG